MSGTVNISRTILNDPAYPKSFGFTARRIDDFYMAAVTCFLNVVTALDTANFWQSSSRYRRKYTASAGVLQELP